MKRPGELERVRIVDGTTVAVPLDPSVLKPRIFGGTTRATRLRLGWSWRGWNCTPSRKF